MKSTVFDDKRTKETSDNREIGSNDPIQSMLDELVKVSDGLKQIKINQNNDSVEINSSAVEDFKKIFSRMDIPESSDEQLKIEMALSEKLRELTLDLQENCKSNKDVLIFLSEKIDSLISSLDPGFRDSQNKKESSDG